MFRHYFCWFLLVASLSSHAGIRTVIVQPGQLTPTYGPGIGGDAFIDGRDWNATISDQKGTRHTVPVTLDRKYSWPTFRGALKNALKINPGQLAVTGVVAGLLAGVDYIFDGSSLVRSSSDTVSGFPYGGDSSLGTACYTTQPIGKVFKGESEYILRFKGSEPPSPWTYVNYCYGGPTGSESYDHGVATAPLSAFGVISGSLVPVTDSDLDLLVSGIDSPSFAASAAPDILSAVPGSFDYPDSEIFGGPNSIDLPTVETTSLDQVSGDTVVKQETTTLDLVYSKNPLSVTATPTTVTNTYQNGTLTNTTTNTVTGPTVDAQPLPEVPTDCEFMPTVCEWLAWFKEPISMPEPEFEEIKDEDFERTYSANFGGGCPPPRVIQLALFAPVQFSWAPLCEFAGYLKFLVVGGAALMAAFIGLGINRGNA